MLFLKVTFVTLGPEKLAINIPFHVKKKINKF